ncbi:type II toxin-antitoxin system Phd/YefM family antitoxin [Fusobacterium nucleatum]|nr:type II toxin-antitoxin system Phd/YefM family antitoxin [Fusobacterium nucleatum]WDA45926.1 type II toxin-antitoxin system Phd/YefM family antitoxin [Fusobacterium nucleatum]
MSTLTINFNDMIEKMIGNNEELRIKGETRSKDLVVLNADKYDKLLTELNNLMYIQKILKRAEETSAEYHTFEEMEKMIEEIK